MRLYVFVIIILLIKNLSAMFQSGVATFLFVTLLGFTLFLGFQVRMTMSETHSCRLTEQADIKEAAKLAVNSSMSPDPFIAFKEIVQAEKILDTVLRSHNNNYKTAEKTLGYEPDQLQKLHEKVQEQSAMLMKTLRENSAYKIPQINDDLAEMAALQPRKKPRTVSSKTKSKKRH